MSAQFGKCNFDGKPVDPKISTKFARCSRPMDRTAKATSARTTLASSIEPSIPPKSPAAKSSHTFHRSGAVITWDGRLDNREELIGKLMRTCSS